MHSKHTFIHYILTIIITILKDSFFIGLSLGLILAGLYFFTKEESFYRIAVALPFVIGGAAFLFMILSDVVEVIVNPKINKARCMICSEIVDNGK
ncbi:hypothetical protein HYT02_01330 [Candidatus Gottesmanbacteria bacterium]|nr:hypothetical protein [Candidatus Gottesmanbacteria bacterium]